MSNISEPSTDPTSYLSNVIITICIAIFFLVSFIGNLLTAATIKSNTHLQSIKNTFIASLCVSNLMSTANSPLWLYRNTWGYNDWQWSNFLCKILFLLMMCKLWTYYNHTFFYFRQTLLAVWVYNLLCYNSSYCFICYFSICSCE